MKAQEKYEVIKALVDNKGNKKRAAIALSCSLRSIERYIVGYKEKGKLFFIHGNTGRKPVHTLSEEKREKISRCYEEKYKGASIAHYKELLEKAEGIHISEGTVRNIFKEKDMLSPYATKKTKRELAKKLKDSLEKSTKKQEKEILSTKIREAESAHPRRSRSESFGEMIQMDASLHNWFGEQKATLHIAIDDATGIIVGAWFELQETLKGYYRVFEQILTNHGIPYMFYTDRRSVFEYRKSGSKDRAVDSFTQFSYACKQLGVDLKTTSVPQSKGRVERIISTMQKRLPIEFRMKGVKTVEQANEILPKIVDAYNAKFALASHSISSVLEKQPTREEIDRFLAVISERTIDNGHSVRFENKYFRTLTEEGAHFCLPKGVKGLVIRTLSDNLFFSVGERVFALEEIPTHEHVSKNFGVQPEPKKPKKRNIPPPNHPWRLSTFAKFVEKQARNTA
jgi:transposase